MPKNSVKIFAQSKKEMRVENCYDDYLWIGQNGNPDVLIVGKLQSLRKLRDGIDRIIEARVMAKRKLRRRAPSKTPQGKE